MQAQATEDATNRIFNSTSLYVLANRSASAGHIFRSLAGSLQFDGGVGSYCYASSFDTVDDYLFEQSLLEELEFSELSNTACEPSTDIFLVRGSDLTSDIVAASVAIDETEVVVEITKDEKQQQTDRLDYMSKAITDDVLDGSKVGFGLIALRSGNGEICGVVPDYPDAHLNVLGTSLRLLEIYGVNGGNFAAVMSNPNEAFRLLQRGSCSAIYASATELAELVLAGKSSGYEMDFAPVWVSKKQITEAIDSIEAAFQLQANQEQSQEDRQRLEAEALKTAMEQAEVQQTLLRDEFGLRFAALNDEVQTAVQEVIDFSNAILPLNDGYEAAYERLTVLDPTTGISPFDQIIQDMHQRSAEGWEIIQTDLDKLDYGQAEFNGREVEAVVTELHVESKNRVVGKYEDYCARIALLNDEVFDVWRRITVLDCTDSYALDRWRLENGFQSKWIVTVE